jgi:hypothetical protein
MSTPNHPPIIITGPQRSGTTIATHILSADLKRTPVDEIDFIPGNDYTNCIIQSPNAMDAYVLLLHMYPSLEFILIRRSKEDIIDSMKRIQWCKNDVQNWDQFLNQYVDSRLQVWEQVKKDFPDNCSELPYEALSGHPLFVSKTHRTDFTTKQWQVGKPVGPKLWPNNFVGIQQLYGERHTQSTTG